MSAAQLPTQLFTKAACQSSMYIICVLFSLSNCLYGGLFSKESCFWIQWNIYLRVVWTKGVNNSQTMHSQSHTQVLIIKGSLINFLSACSVWSLIKVFSPNYASIQKYCTFSSTVFQRKPYLAIHSSTPVQWLDNGHAIDLKDAQF